MLGNRPVIKRSSVGARLSDALARLDHDAAVMVFAAAIAGGAEAGRDLKGALLPKTRTAG
jgi:hypothetical protein